jgi:hypothetical protein
MRHGVFNPRSIETDSSVKDGRFFVTIFSKRKDSYLSPFAI